jgi:hypothetical protein
VSPIELLSNRFQLSLLELADGDPTPAVSRSDHRGVHQFQYRPLAEGVRDDLRPPALLEEEALEEIRSPDHLAVAEREAQMRDAGFEVVLEALDHRRQVAPVGLHEVLAQQRG